MDKLYMMCKDNRQKEWWVTGWTAKLHHQIPINGKITINGVSYNIDPKRFYQEVYHKVVGPALLVLGGGMFLIIGVILLLFSRSTLPYAFVTPGFLMFIGGIIWKMKDYTANCLYYDEGVVTPRDMTSPSNPQTWPGELMTKVWKSRAIEILVNPDFDWKVYIPLILLISIIVMVGVIAAIVI